MKANENKPPSFSSPLYCSTGWQITLMMHSPHTALLNITVITNSFLCPLLSSAAGLQTFVMEILLNRVDSLKIYSPHWMSCVRLSLWWYDDIYTVPWQHCIRFFILFYFNLFNLILFLLNLFYFQFVSVSFYFCFYFNIFV